MTYSNIPFTKERSIWLGLFVVTFFFFSFFESQPSSFHFYVNCIYVWVHHSHIWDDASLRFQFNSVFFSLLFGREKKSVGEIEREDLFKELKWRKKYIYLWIPRIELHKSWNYNRLTETDRLERNEKKNQKQIYSFLNDGINACAWASLKKITKLCFFFLSQATANIHTHSCRVYNFCAKAEKIKWKCVYMIGIWRVIFFFTV